MGTARAIHSAINGTIELKAVLSPGIASLSPGIRVLSPGIAVLSPRIRVLPPRIAVLSPGIRVLSHRIYENNSLYRHKGIFMIKKYCFDGENVLAYNDFGNKDGFPILVQHGTVASINDIDSFVGLGKVARVIYIARPGYGESSPYVLQNLLEYGEIVAKLVAELGINQFDVFGSSAGAIYCYAIAKACSDKTRNIYVYSGTPALYDTEVQKNWPFPISKEMTVEDSQKIAFEVFFAHLSEKEKNIVKDSLANNCFGEGQNLRIRFKEWGFTLLEIKAKVYMQHSKKDEILPYIMAERTAKLLRNCKLELLEKGSHFTREGYETFIQDTVLKNIVKGKQ
jgi:pimeloyl-ACP methyl ester carboxylesterase